MCQNDANYHDTAIHGCTFELLENFVDLKTELDNITCLFKSLIKKIYIIICKLVNNDNIYFHSYFFIKMMTNLMFK